MNPTLLQARIIGKRKQTDRFSGRQGKQKKQKLYAPRKKKWELINDEVAELESRYDQIDSKKIEQFGDFPLSKNTLQGLKNAEYISPTEIQRESIGLALHGLDVLGAAKTGSGKTLAFLIPVIEKLYKLKWSQLDGLGALIISPTRELAYQTFEVLKKIGRFHDFSAGLVIGGKHLREEAARINSTNIVICTPGRLLQHMDQTINFTADSLQVLVLDEADRILDLGFAQTMNAIIENLPEQRQTMLFSATQTKSVKDLARLSLKDPMYVSVHEKAQHSTPAKLEQSYLVCDLHDKVNLLWSFVKNRLKKKVLVFLQSCKQVRYIHETFRRLRPGMTVLALHGGMNQLRRVDVYNQFCRKQTAVLFATDIAARGLDFPAVHWVFQLDCPEDANTYIHRAGRTARYERDGEALLVLMPSEEEDMLKQLNEKKIPIEKIKVNPKKLWSIQGKLESLCAADKELKQSAQRAFVSYLRSVFLMSNKKVFNIHKLDTEKFSQSLGLAISPRIRFLKRDEKRRAEKQITSSEKSSVSSKQQTSIVADPSSESDSSLEDSEVDCDSINSKFRRGTENKLCSESIRNHQVRHESIASSDEESSDSDSEIEYDNEKEKFTSGNVENRTKNRSSNSFDSGRGFRIDADDDEELFTVKPSQWKDSESEDESNVTGNVSNKKLKSKPLTKYAIAKKLQKKNLTVNSKIVFDEEGEEVINPLKSTKKTKEPDEDDEGGINIEVARQMMAEEDKVDKELFRQRIKQQHREKRLLEKQRRIAEKAKRSKGYEDEYAVTLGTPDENNASDIDCDKDSKDGDLEGDDSSDEDTEESGNDEEDMAYSDVEEHSDVEEDDNSGSDDDESSLNEETSSSSEDLAYENKKVQSNQRKKKCLLQVGDDTDSDEYLDTGLSLHDDQEIALKLLLGKR